MTSVAPSRTCLPLPEAERLSKEKEILGFYISGHPLEPFRAEAELFGTHTVSDLGAWRPDQMGIACVITAVRKQIAKKSGAEYARLALEDFSGSAEVLVFPEAWAAIGERLRTDIPVIVRGAFKRGDEVNENPTFVVESVQPLVELRMNGQIAVAIDIAERALPPAVMADVASVVTTHPGSAPIEIRWSAADGAITRWRSKSLKVAASGPALNELRALLGEDRVKLIRGAS